MATTAPRLANSLAALLQQLRERRGWTQVAVAKKVDPKMSETYYGKLEQGVRRPSQSVLHGVLKALGASIDERALALQRWAMERVPRDALAILDSSLQPSGLPEDPHGSEPEMSEELFSDAWRRVRLIYWRRKEKPDRWTILKSMLDGAIEDVAAEELEYLTALRSKRRRER